VIAEETFGTLKAGVQVGKPIDDRRLWREDERHVGARPKHQRLAFERCVRHDASPRLRIPIR
jgi:hypothetical protein